MGNEMDSESDRQKASTMLAEAERLVADIARYRTQAEEQFKAAETARKNADSEGLFAVNAKKTCEEHATVISQIKGSAESEANTIKVNKQTSDELLAALTAGKAAVDTHAKSISDQRKESEEAARHATASKEVCYARVQELEKLKVGADSTLASITDALAAANKAQTGAEAAEKSAVARQLTVDATATSVEESLTASQKAFADIQKLAGAAQAKEAEIESVLEHLTKSDSISTNHEKRVAELTAELEQLIKRVAGLLPGATSASLASSFNAQKERFSAPQARWLKTFVWCIVGLIAVALPSFLAALGVPVPGHTSDAGTQEIVRSLLLRMPIVVPLVWLALYAGRNYMLSLRLEEEYAYKEAVSTAFEGYKRELQGIPDCEGKSAPPINQLCINVLSAIAERPGRIYEGKQKDITIATEAHGAAQEAARIAQTTIATR